MANSVAVVNFEPNAGHVMPLLRVAAAFSARNYDVTCYLAAECESLLNGYPFRFVSLGPGHDRTRADRTLRYLSQKSIFYNAFSNYSDLTEVIARPLQARMRAQLPFIGHCLSAERPLFLLCDAHAFYWSYVKLSSDTNTPLVIHTFQGLRYYQNLYVQTYGITRLPRSLQRLVEALGKASEQLFRAQIRLRRLHEPECSQESAYEAGFSSVPAYRDASRHSIRIATGAGYLEQKYLSASLSAGASPHFFGPLRPGHTLRLRSELKAWLAESDSYVVYVSFGSVIRPGRRLARAILEALTRLNVRVLWSMPQDQQDELLPGLDVPSSVRFETFVPPLEVLAMPSVRCAINHGGAGSVQDCLLSGKPMLCIPFIWDQPFNSAVVSCLEVGKRLWKRRASAARILASVKSLLEDDRVARRAADIAAELQNANSDSALVEYVLTRPAVAARLAPERQLRDRVGGEG